MEHYVLLEKRSDCSAECFAERQRETEWQQDTPAASGADGLPLLAGTPLVCGHAANTPKTKIPVMLHPTESQCVICHSTLLTGRTKTVWFADHGQGKFNINTACDSKGKTSLATLKYKKKKIHPSYYRLLGLILIQTFMSGLNWE